MQGERDAYQAWLVGEILLFGLLSASLALFLTHASLHTAYALPHLRLVLQTVVALAAGLVAILAGARFSADGRREDLLLCLGFFVASAATIAFSLGPDVSEHPLTRPAAWAGVLARLIAWSLIALLFPVVSISDDLHEDQAKITSEEPRYKDDLQQRLEGARLQIDQVPFLLDMSVTPDAPAERILRFEEMRRPVAALIFSSGGFPPALHRAAGHARLQGRQLGDEPGRPAGRVRLALR